jgi:pyruvate,water dikinase
MAYRYHRRLDTTRLEHAVIVQELIPAESAGILFTVNPVDPHRNEIVIDAFQGLGDAVVGGEVTPDHIVVGRASERVKHVRIGDRNFDDTRQKQVLSSDEITSLVRLGKALEEHFGQPQDVEWAISEKRIYVLQSRPVSSSGGAIGKANTALPTQNTVSTCPGDDNWPVCGEFSAQPFDRWSRANVGELWPDPVSPLVWSTIPEIISGAVRFSLRGVRSKSLHQAQWAARYYGRVYYNEGALKHVLTEELGLPASFIDKSRGTSIAAVRGENDRARVGRVLLHLPVLVRLVLRQRQTGRALEAQLLKVDQWVCDFKAEEHQRKSDRQLLDDALRWVERVKQTLNLQYEMTGLSLTAVATLDRLMIRWFKHDGLAQDLITGLSGIQAAEIGVDLWKIANQLKLLGLDGIVLAMPASEALKELRRTGGAAAALDLLDDFMERHGYRCPNEAEWLYPRWADAPEQIIEIVAGCLKSETLDLESSNAKQRQKRTHAIVWVENRIGILRRMIFTRVLARAEHSVRLRDNGKSSAIKASYPARQLTVRIGQRWAELGWLDKSEDVFFLTLQDLQRVIDAGDPSKAQLELKSLVRERRKALEYWHGAKEPDVIEANGDLVWEREAERNASMLMGIATSGGVARGKVRIVHSPAEAMKLQAGDILVTRSTDAGWTVFFPLLNGLVTEIGGQLSHAAILAREYGLPAVVNVRNAMLELKDRQMITIDGTKGIVYLDTSASLS